jgi:Ca-activated chloride channel family protein
LAYQTARDNFIPEGVNRVILCTDGDFNVGTTGTAELVRMVEREAKGGVFLSVLGFGMGNHNDAMLEKISGRGNGNYAFIDNRKEARKVLVDQTSGTLVTIAKDVKLQIDFNLNHVSSYRLIGYENRVLAKEDFNDDKKDAGEIGAGHAVTALYEIVPAGVEADASRPKVDDLKYQTEPEPTEAADSDEMMTLKLRYKQPDGDTSTLVEFPVTDEGGEFKDADHDVRFAAAVASFGMQLRRSEYAGSWTMNDVIRVADDARGEDMDGLRAEFVDLARKAKELMGQE